MRTPAIAQPAPYGRRPFVTRRSTLGWAALCLIATTVVRIELGGATNPDQGLPTLVTAAAVAVFLVSAMVCWVNSIVLAMRAQSLLWLAVAVFLPPPFNAALVALYVSQPGGGQAPPP